MENLSNEIANTIFYMNEEVCYQIIDQFDSNQVVDHSLVYCFVKSYYLYITKLYIEKTNMEIDFDDIYSLYKEELKKYYKENNTNIEDIILDQILNFYDNTFSLMSTVELIDCEDSYEFRHYTINVFDLLRMILEKKSNSIIRENIFDDHIRNIINQADNVYDYIIKHKR